MVVLKLSIVGLLASSSYAAMSLIAQGEAIVDGWIDPLVRLVTAGGFGAMLWYLVAKRLPAIEAEHRGERAEWETRHRAEREDSRARFLQEVARVNDGWVKFSEQQTSALTALRAAVERGRNHDE